MTRRILAFYAPYPGAGKTTAAAWVAVKRCMSLISFSRPLRGAVNNLLQYGGFFDEFNTPEKKGLKLPDVNVCWRELMISFGQAGRALDPDLWIKLMARQMDRKPWMSYVIDDLRFPNEYNFLRARGARIIRLLAGGRKAETSETEGLLEGMTFDAEMINLMDGLDKFYVQLEAVVDALFGDDKRKREGAENGEDRERDSETGASAQEI